MLKNVFLAGGMRTAIGAYCGMFAEVSAKELGSAAARATLEQSQIDPKKIDEVILGNVIGAGLGQNIARQVAIGADLDVHIGASTVNKVCGSGLLSIIRAAQAIQCGDARVVLGGGVENMSRAPYLLEKARTGYRMGNGELVDAMLRDGLWDPFSDQHMGTLGEKCAAQYGFTREKQDAFAITSYQRALKADQEGVFEKEITPVEVQTRKGPQTLNQDEEPSRFNEEKFRKLRPAFGENGTVTAGNASSISDGAATVLVLSEDRANELGIQPQAKILGYSMYSREPEWFTLAPVGAIESLMKRLSWTVDDVDLFEINEAFSVVPMAAMKDLNIPHEKVNIHGGAVSLGHPIGASGARVLVTLLNALKSNNLKAGIASLCIGGGEAAAIAVEIV